MGLMLCNLAGCAWENPICQHVGFDVIHHGDGTAALPAGKRQRIALAEKTGDLALADASKAEGLHQVIARAGTDALDMGFLDHRGQTRLGQGAGLQEGWKVAATRIRRGNLWRSLGTRSSMVTARVFHLRHKSR